MSEESVSDTAPTSHSLDILRSLRRIVRRIEGASTELEQQHGVTAPQLLCLQALRRHGSITQIELSRAVRLSAPTLVGVIDRLESKALVVRQRDAKDRRRIHLVLTDAGRDIALSAPEPLQHQLERGLDALAESERAAIAGALARLVGLLEAEHIEAAPVLTSGPIPKPAELEARQLPPA
ncbi:MAG: MarR family transcriptional regulator [Planctomycetes bacterium]|nr:MarR family transcriptional regulator [Planctomycetota bacterium]